MLTHYHIHWSGKELDWERFDTREEAEKRARELLQPNEAYTIEIRGGNCEKCAEINPRIEPPVNLKKSAAQ